MGCRLAKRVGNAFEGAARRRPRTNAHERGGRRIARSPTAGCRPTVRHMSRRQLDTVTQFRNDLQHRTAEYGYLATVARDQAVCDLEFPDAFLDPQQLAHLAAILK